jgi:putative transposase
VVELVVDGDVEKKLRLLCGLSSKLWNEVSYAGRMFFERKNVDFKGTYKEFYEGYRPLIGSAAAQQILKLNDEMRRGFFRCLELKRKGKLLPFITWISPPGFRMNKSRMLWTVIRKDQYRIEGDRIILRVLGAIGRIEVRYKGLIHLRGDVAQNPHT